MKCLSYAYAALVLAAGVTAAHAGSDLACVQVRADRAWQPSGVEVVSGDRVCVVARGLWSHGPEAGSITPLHSARGYIAKPDSIAACYTEPKPEGQPIVPWCFAQIGALLGKIDTRKTPQSPAFPIEDELCFVARDSGELLLSMNDVPGSFDDNEGSLRVRITTASTHGGKFSDRDWPAPSRTDGRCFQ